MNVNAVAFPTPRAKAQAQSKSSNALAHLFHEVVSRLVVLPPITRKCRRSW